MNALCARWRNLGCALGLGLMACAAGAPAAAAPLDTVAVVARGQLPGLGADAMTGYLTAEMNRAKLGHWQFAPASAAKQPRGYRVEWSFAMLPSAGGAVRANGLSQAMQNLLSGAHRYVTIEARLYLKDDYQTEVHGEATLVGGSIDSEFEATIDKLGRLLMAYPDS